MKNSQNDGLQLIFIVLAVLAALGLAAGVLIFQLTDVRQVARYECSNGFVSPWSDRGHITNEGIMRAGGQVYAVPPGVSCARVLRDQP